MATTDWFKLVTGYDRDSVKAAYMNSKDPYLHIINYDGSTENHLVSHALFYTGYSQSDVKECIKSLGERPIVNT